MRLPFLPLVAAVVTAHASPDPLAPWRDGVTVRVLSPQAGRHTIHSYFNTSPESPDGKRVLFFSSTAADGQRGEVCVLDRATGEERVLARDIHTEDAHRVACQQWVSGGKRAVYHNERDGEWSVAAVDVAEPRERVLARGRLVGFGQPHSDLVPVYGPHWEVRGHHDLDMLNVATGELRTVATAESVRAAYPAWAARQFGDKPLSIFFPNLSPDLKRVFFKMASPSGGEARSKSASDRQGLLCYGLEDSRFIYLREKWGHPAWTADSRTIVEMGNLLIDTDSGATRRVPGLPVFRGDHPSLSPDGRLLVTDTTLEKFGGKESEWGVIVADVQTGEHVFIHRFDNSRGAKSWRRSHPHPVFSPEGARIYFNVSATEWTQLHVAESSAQQ